MVVPVFKKIVVSRVQSCRKISNSITFIKYEILIIYYSLNVPPSHNLITRSGLLLWFELGLDVPPKEMAEMAYNIFRGFAEKAGAKIN